MTTITVLDSTGATQTVAKVLNTGTAADSASLPVTQSTEDKAVVAAAAASLAAIDDWDESDRAKVNPIAGQAGVAAGAGAVSALVQRMTLASDDPAVAALGALPASRGIKTAAASTSVAPASDALFTVAFQGTTPTSASGTITSGGAAQNAAASNAARRGFWVQNNSVGDLWISTIATAVASQPSLKIAPGGYYESPPGGAGTGAISIIGATTGQAFSGREW